MTEQQSQPPEPRRLPLTRRRATCLSTIAAPVLLVAALVLYGVLLLPARPVAWILLGLFGLLACLLWRFR